MQSIVDDTKFGLKVSKDGTHVTDRHGKVQSVYGASESDVRKMKLITLPSYLAKELL